MYATKKRKSLFEICMFSAFVWWSHYFPIVPTVSINAMLSPTSKTSEITMIGGGDYYDARRVVVANKPLFRAYRAVLFICTVGYIVLFFYFRTWSSYNYYSRDIWRFKLFSLVIYFSCNSTSKFGFPCIKIKRYFSTYSRVTNSSFKIARFGSIFHYKCSMCVFWYFI